MTWSGEQFLSGDQLSSQVISFRCRKQREGERIGRERGKREGGREIGRETPDNVGSGVGNKNNDSRTITWKLRPDHYGEYSTLLQ